MNVLVIDVGGTHVKILASGEKEKREFDSGPTLTARQMVSSVRKLADGWEYDVVSIGYPGPVVHDRPMAEPHNLGKGWMGFNFAAAFKLPTKVVNDAAMQALGSYRGGKMLFLGLGTGLGSTMITDGVIEPLELGHLPFRKKTFEDYVSEHALEKSGKKKWTEAVFETVQQLSAAMEPDYVVLGGGGAEELDELPPGCRLGDNQNAFLGGFRLWDPDWLQHLGTRSRT